MKKKYLFIMALFIVALVFIQSSVVAETIDTTPPVINTISLDKDTYNVGDTIKLTIDVHDDVSGVYHFTVRFIKQDGLSSIYSWSDGLVISFSNLSEGSHTYTYTIPANLDDAEYYYQIAIVEDWNNNKTYYKRTNLDITDSDWTYIDNDFGLNKIKINNSSVSELPQIENFSLDKITANPNEKINVTATINNDSDVRSVLILYTLNNKQYSTELYKDHDNIYKGEIFLDIPGVYTYSHLTAYTHGLKSVSFSNINEQYRYITINGDVDNVAPTLKRLEFDKTEVKVPTTIKTYVYYDDNKENDIGSYIEIYSKKTNERALGVSSYGTGNSHVSNGVYINFLDLNQYLEEGEYYVHSITLDDNAGNRNMYVYGENLKDYYSFRIVNDVNADANTSTSSSEINKVIENTSDNAIISIDSTKNPVVKASVFNSIKGTNKRIVIESKGIQWIFNGKDIVNDVKDIDTSVSFYKIEDTNDNLSDIVNGTTLVIVFADNGQLPGRCKVRIKADYALRKYLGDTNLYAYYYDGNSGQLSEVLTKIDLTSDSYYEFFITHNSTYILTSKKPDDKYIAKKENIEITEEEKENYEINSDVISIDNDNDDISNNNSSSNKDTKSINVVLVILLSIIYAIRIIAAICIYFKNKKKVNVK